MIVLKKFNSKEKEIIFTPEESEINIFIESIKNFGNIDVKEECMNFDQDSNIIKKKEG